MIDGFFAKGLFSSNWSREDAAVARDERRSLSLQDVWFREEKSTFVLASWSIRLLFCIETRDCVRTKLIVFEVPSGWQRIRSVALENAGTRSEEKLRSKV